MSVVRRRLDEPGVRLQLGFLYEAFEKTVYWWELVSSSGFWLLSRHISTSLFVAVIGGYAPQAHPDLSAGVFPLRRPAFIGNGNTRSHTVVP